MATMKKIGVVGAGQMGNGIAHVAALAGYSVLLYDLSAERIQAGLATIDGNLARQVASGRITEADRKAAMGRIKAAPSFDAFGDVDFAIESVAENETVKRKIFADLSPALKPEAILATNTSSISITRLAAAHRPAGALHRHALHESGAGDGAGGARARHRHRRRDLRGGAGFRRRSSARRPPWRRISPPSSSTASCCR